ncbi:MAG: DUF4160 domain-containing protein [Bacteroidetes bacterium]|nr:DUF4160 domain-containing protein [Bacteroidota bacterium]
MPKLFEYQGINLYFYSEEHLPIHIHAKYGKASVVVSFYIKEGAIYKVTYTKKTKDFPVAKLKALKQFIDIYKEKIVQEWINYFILGVDVDFKKINVKV